MCWSPNCSCTTGGLEAQASDPGGPVTAVLRLVEELRQVQQVTWLSNTFADIQTWVPLRENVLLKSHGKYDRHHTTFAGDSGNSRHPGVCCCVLGPEGPLRMAFSLVLVHVGRCWCWWP